MSAYVHEERRFTVRLRSAQVCVFLAVAVCHGEDSVERICSGRLVID